LPFDFLNASEEELLKILYGGAQPGSETYERARAELDRRSRKVMERHARRSSRAAVASAVAAVLSVLATVIFGTIAYFHH
jgi:hypothetical protein